MEEEVSGFPAPECLMSTEVTPALPADLVSFIYLRYLNTLTMNNFRHSGKQVPRCSHNIEELQESH